MDNAALHQTDTDTFIGHVEAYCVFQGRTLAKVLNARQFEALCEGDDALGGMSGKVFMAYVVANRHQYIQALVFFTLPLDEDGYCLDGWRLPLQRLANTAGRGPNLGGGRIRLACHSQCSISWHQDSLWEPTTNTFSAIKKAIHEQFHGLASASVSSNPKSQQESEVDVLRRELRNESASYRNQLQALQQEIERQRLLNERLTGLMDKGTSSTPLSQPADRVDLHVLRRQNEQLQMKVRELQLSNEKLRKSQKGGDDVIGDELINQMSEWEVMSVVYHPGVGHINLKPHQLQDYLDDPVAYAAHHVELSKQEYQVWLDHQAKPKCQACDVSIPLIADPTIFDPDADVYCDEHKPH